MSTAPQDQVQTENKPSDKEINFRKQEEMFKRQVEQERIGRQQAEERAAQLEKLIQQKQSQGSPYEDEDEGDDPYVDHKRLAKKLHKFEERLEQKIEEKAELKARKLFEEEKKSSWLKQNPDYKQVREQAEIIMDKDPELAEIILSMPDGLEREKLIYKTVKAMTSVKKEEPKPSIQEKIEANKRSPYYQPSGVGSAPYAAASDFSPAGQKNAYEKLKQLKARLGV